MSRTFPAGPTMPGHEHPLHILHEDDHVVAVFKPAGLLVHRTRLDAGESDAALQQVRDLLGDRVYPVHRLDKPTSGILLFGRTPESAAVLASAFLEGRIRKKYLALVRGWTADAGVIDYPLGPTRDTRGHRSAGRLGESPRKTALSRFESISRFEVDGAVGRYDTARASLIHVFPETGRTHQIRRHMKHVFHPVIGDRKYGDDAHNRFYQARFGLERMLLAGIGLEFEHPAAGTPMRLVSAPGNEFERIMDGLNAWEVSPPS